MTHQDAGRLQEHELRQLLKQAEEERRQAEEKQRQAEENQRQAEEKQRQAEKQILPTSLPQFLDACHTYLSVGLSSRINYRTGTRGNPENAESKLRPDRIREWTTFPKDQSRVWENLFATDFVSEGHFTSLHTLRESGHELRVRSLGSELDLHYYQRHTVEDRVSSIIRQLYSNQGLRNLFNLKGQVQFENHSNTLSPENRYTEPDISSSQQSPVRKRHKKLDMDGNALPETPTVRSRSSHPRADQFCVYNTGSDEAIPAYIVEYKAPHKLTKGIIEAGLVDMDVGEVIESVENDDPMKVARWRVAACISQTFAYMIQAGLEYGYVCTGEMFIFLCVKHNDPTTVYCYLSAPNDDVGETTGWISGSDYDNRLHLTAIGQVLAFTLRALRTAPHDQNWRNRAEAMLKRWEIPHDDILESELEKSSEKLSDYKQSRESRDKYIRSSPVKTRPKGLAASFSCRPAETSTNWETSDDDSSGNGGYDPDSPSTRLSGRPSNVMVVVPPPKPGQGGSNTQASGQREYCTQKCLLGLINGDVLDENCPNVASHGGGKRHAINQQELLESARAQILRKDDGPFGCESLHKHGVSAALFWFTHFSHGYSFVAKGTPVEFGYSPHEEKVYRSLRSIQGKRVPVCLGSVNISSRPLYYDGIARIGYLLFLSHAGKPIGVHAGPGISQSIREALSDIDHLGIRHRDMHNGNIFWNAENKGAMIIDFDRARISSKKGLSSKRVPKKRKRYDAAISSHYLPKTQPAVS
ncbi:hypothetical protein ACJ72_03469 [Emergomyces africanus]|uniref:Aminoglycoside phosphotransferase domain-containing protein n=1 Tax=Emergomyces africanus TaxID=1955775 RepID=A0A1B7NZJ9_9EURO|nr:hypothetical protein ACJ72_03469 [Emergomyces africanus]